MKLASPFGVLLTLVLISPMASSQQSTVRVSVDSSGTQGNFESHETDLSFDGSVVAFSSDATNLIPGGTTTRHVYVRDLTTGVTSLVNVNSNGATGNNFAESPAISNDGRYVAFEGFSTNLVSGDTNGFVDIFVHDRQTRITSRVNLSSGGDQANDWSYRPAMSPGGRYVGFLSEANNLVPGVVGRQVYMHDRNTGVTTAISVDTSGVPGNGPCHHVSISEEGRYIAYDSDATNLVSGDVNGRRDVFLHDTISGSTSLVSVSSGGTQGNGVSFNPVASVDGRYVAFVSAADNLVAGDTNVRTDAFIRDLLLGVTERVSLGVGGIEGDGDVRDVSISDDGRFIGFASNSTNLVVGDTNGQWDLFVLDRLTGITTLESRDSGDVLGNGDSPTTSPSASFFGFYPWYAISGDGQLLAFQSLADNLSPGDTNQVGDIFLRDLGCRVGFEIFGEGLAGSGGIEPTLTGLDGECNSGVTVTIDRGLGRAPGVLWVGAATFANPLDVLGGKFYVDVSLPFVAIAFTLAGPPGVPGLGALILSGGDFSTVTNLQVYMQATILDPGAVQGVSFTKGLIMRID